MKLNKTIGRVATTLVATAMLASLAAVPAFADAAVSVDSNGYHNYEDDLQESVTLKIGKQVVKPANAVLPDVDYSFSVAAASGNVYANGVVMGADKTVTTEATDITAATTVDTDPILGDTFSVTIDASKFQDAGVFDYVISEDAGTYPGANTYGGEKLILSVFVKRVAKDDYKISGYELYTYDSSDDHKGAKTAVVTNDYTPDESGYTAAFTVGKTVEGSMATNADLTTRDYTFKVVVNDDVDKQYAITTPDGSTVLTDADGSKVITLKGGQTFTINGVKETDTVTVSEVMESDFAVKADSNYADGRTSDDAAAVSADAEAAIEGKTTGSVQATIGTNDDDTDVMFYNIKNETTPTGIVMNVAPYVLLVVVAAAGCFVFMRKRRED